MIKKRAFEKCALAFVPLSLFGPQAAQAEAFKFESFVSLDEMREHLKKAVALGAGRNEVRARFVGEGGARLWTHPDRENVEKYVYDINLCDLYVWRWNISANYDANGTLTQIYLNGEPVHAAGDALRDSEAVPGATPQLLKVTRPRPEASKGENKIAFLVYDLDNGTDRIDDEFVIGGGPSRADPTNLGKMRVYTNLERWRTIFDREPAHAVVPYGGECPDVE